MADECTHEWIERDSRGHTYVICARCYTFPMSHLEALRRLRSLQVIGIERVFEPSHIRRGRLATSPTFFVTAPTGERWRFMKKRDARAFVDRGCTCPLHEPPMCRACGGSKVG